MVDWNYVIDLTYRYSVLSCGSDPAMTREQRVREGVVFPVPMPEHLADAVVWVLNHVNARMVRKLRSEFMYRVWYRLFPLYVPGGDIAPETLIAQDDDLTLDEPLD